MHINSIRFSIRGAVGLAVTLSLGVVGLCAAWVMRDKKAAKSNAAAEATTVTTGYGAL